MNDAAILFDADKTTIDFTNSHSAEEGSQNELIKGLLKPQKEIDPKYFYDTLGSELFEKITTLPEYYPTRTERQILADNAHEIADFVGLEGVLIEPGSGSSEKVRLLLDAVRPSAYIPMDIAGDFLKLSAQKLSKEYPWLLIHAICADFSQLANVPKQLPDGRRTIFYPGSTLGNMTPIQARAFLVRLKAWLNGDGGVLIGIDLYKCEDTLNAAYNDSQGVTAQFNLNALNNINGLFDSDFKLENFKHHAFYNKVEHRIEMHLISNEEQVVKLHDQTIAFSKGETIHTENSYKYTVETFTALAESAGLSLCKSWFDEQKLFSVHYLSVD